MFLQWFRKIIRYCASNSLDLLALNLANFGGRRIFPVVGRRA